MFSVRIYLIEGCCWQWSYWHNSFWWWNWNHHFKSFTAPAWRDQPWRNIRLFPFITYHRILIWAIRRAPLLHTVFIGVCIAPSVVFLVPGSVLWTIVLFIFVLFDLQKMYLCLICNKRVCTFNLLQIHIIFSCFICFLFDIQFWKFGLYFIVLSWSLPSTFKSTNNVCPLTFQSSYEAWSPTFQVP